MLELGLQVNNKHETYSALRHKISFLNFDPNELLKVI